MEDVVAEALVVVMMVGVGTGVADRAKVMRVAAWVE